MQQRVAALIVKKGKVLIARRSEGRTQAGLWEFPWGTCNQDEAPEACLERNLVDVMGLNVSIGGGFALRSYGDLRLLAYWAQWQEGNFSLSGHDELAWAGPEELSSYEFMPMDVFLVEKLIRQGMGGTASDSKAIGG